MSLHFFTQNFGWKLGSLALALLLWFAIVGEPELVTTHSVPILFRGLSRDLLIGSDTVESVRLELRGPSGKLTSGSLGDLAVMLDLSGVSMPGERTFTISDRDVKLPEGVAFVRAVPSQLRIVFSRRKAKEVPVEVRFSAPPPQGYVIVHQEVTPSTVRIAGPERRVDSINAAQTDAIDLSAATVPSEIRVNTFVADPRVWLESSPIVTVRVIIEKRGTTN